MLVLMAAYPASSAGAPKSPKFSTISSKEFLSSEFSTYFKQGKYQQALVAADALLAKYPDDPLLLRYRALTLEKLGRRQEAIAAYRQILAADPGHVPTRLFLGLAYAREGWREEAAKELRWVAKNSGSEDYRHWAQAQLARLRHGGRAPKPVEKKAYLRGKTAVAYDSNPLLVPDDKSLTARSRRDGFFFRYDLDVGYPFVLEKDLRVDAVYVGRQVFHDHGTNDVDFTTQGAALEAKKRTFCGERPVILGGRYDFRTNFLRESLFSVVNRLILSADTSFWKRTRSHLYVRSSYSNYKQDGSMPSVTSRDGWRGGLGGVQYLYTADLRSYLFLKEEVSFAQTRGDNFDRFGSLTRLGVHAPLDCLGPVDFDASAGFDYGAYPEFSSLSLLEPDDREDARRDFYVSLTYHWKPNLATRGFYRFINSDNKNDFFDRRRHIAGVEMVFSL